MGSGPARRGQALPGGVRPRVVAACMKRGLRWEVPREASDRLRGVFAPAEPPAPRRRCRASRVRAPGRIRRRPARPHRGRHALRCRPRRRCRARRDLRATAGCCCCPRVSGCGRRCGAPVIARLAGGACAYPLHTLDPTGTVFVDRARPRALGELFAVWGQRLSPRAAAVVRRSRTGVPQRARVARRSAPHAARAARLDRARDRRLRAAARALPLPGGPVRARTAPWCSIALALAAAACGGGGRLAGAADRRPGEGVHARLAGPEDRLADARARRRCSFAVRTPGRHGAARTTARGAGPHTGVHLIIVRDDLSSIIHKHPPIPPSGKLALPVDARRAPGRYHVLVDVYPAADTRAAQLPAHARPAGRARATPRRPCPPYRPVVHDRRAHVPRQPKMPVLRLAEPGIDGRQRHRRQRASP